MKLRSYLILLVIAAVLPVVIFAGVMTYRSDRQQQEQLGQSMIERARAISAALDREFLMSIQSLRVLGASARLDKGHLAEFYGDMKWALAAYSRAWQNLTLTDAAGQQLINLRRPFGSPLPATGDPDAIKRALATKEPAIGDLSPGPVTGAPAVVVHVPISIEGEVRYVLNAIFYPAPLTELLVEQKLPASWIATILDRNYIVVARTRDSEKFFGKSATPSLVDQVQKKQEAADRSVSLDGEPVVTAHHRSNFSGWSVALAIPAAELDAPLKSTLLLTGAGGFALLLGALAFAGILGRRIAAPVEALSAAADKLGRGEIPVATPSSIPEVDHVAHAIEDAGSKRKEHEARIEHLNRVYAVLSDINQAIVRIRDPQILLSEACRIAVEKGEFRMAWIGRINRSTGAIEPSASAGVNDGYVENLILGLGNPLHDRGPTVDALRSGVHVVCNDIENDPRMAPWRDEALKRGYRSSAAFPLKIGDEVVGAFNLYSSEQGFFDAQELALLDELASDIGLALEIHRQESERVRAENALREARDQLEHKVAERTRELEEANAKLHELDRIKSQFLANMSHELRTPMNAIIGFAQLLHDGKAGGPVSPEQKEFLGDILNSAGHLLQLINDILDLSKVEAGRMEVLNSTFRLEDVVVEVVQYIAPIMSVKGIRLVRELPPDLPPLTTDRRKLLQILLNLLSNAVKFTEQGEIRIGCETAPGKIRLSVSDTGIGIKAEDLAQLFQPFCQLDDSLRKRHEGTGLGLYLSKRLALLLGGDLTVASEFGKGSTFTLEIRCSEGT